MEKKKAYLCPAQKVLKIETGHLLDNIISKSDDEGDQQLSKGYPTDIWSNLGSDDKQAGDDEEDF